MAGRGEVGVIGCAHRRDLEHVREDLHPQRPQEGLREGAPRDACRGLTRAGALQHVTDVTQAVFLGADEVGVARPR